MRSRVVICSLVAVVGAALAAAGASSASAAGFQCEASAVRGTVLTAPAIEPVTANKGQATCQAARGGLASVLPAPVSTSLVSAETTLDGPASTPAAQTATASGGIADLHVQLTPNLLNQLPLEPLVANVPAVTVPGVGSIDLKPAVRAALTSTTLDLLHLQAIAAYARGRCADGKLELTGSSQVAGLKLLGQDTPINGVVEQSLNVIGGGSINPGALDLSKIGLPAGVTLTPLTQGLIQPVLNGLPAIPIPQGVANVRITPGQQERVGDRLTQRALRVELGVLGQQLLDLTIGEATVAASGVECSSAPKSVASAALECTTRRLVLIDVIPGARKVSLYGAADKRYIGKTVSIFSTYNGRRVAQAVVGKDGTFRTTAKLPPKRIRGTNAARYQARLGKERSLKLKLMRRMIVRTVRVSGSNVRISGRVSRPLAQPARTIEVRRRVSCKKWVLVKRIRPRSSGAFDTTVSAPPSQLAATYRFATRVRKNTKNPKTYPTFTLPRYVDLG